MSGHRLPGPADGERLRVGVAGWEIECCAPPPVVGGVVEWMLQWVEADDPPDPLLDRSLPWSVTPDGRLARGPVVAFRRSGAPVPPGPVELTGQLWGTVHGGVAPDGFPPCRGRVDRVRVLSQEYREVDDRTWEPVPGTVRAEDVAEAPRWYGEGDALGRQTFGVLLDLRVDPRLPLPADG